MLASMLGVQGLVTLVLLGLVGLLIFGKRLPEMGRNLGKSLVEFKHGLKSVREDIGLDGLVEGAPRQTDVGRLVCQDGKPLPEAGSVEEELRLSQERIRQLQDELRAVQERLCAAIPKSGHTQCDNVQ